MAKHSGSIRASHPAAPGSIFCVLKKISLGKINLMLQGRPCLEASGQRLDNVNQIHLVLASGKLVLQKIQITFWEFKATAEYSFSKVPGTDLLKIMDVTISKMKTDETGWWLKIGLRVISENLPPNCSSLRMAPTQSDCSCLDVSVQCNVLTKDEQYWPRLALWWETTWGLLGLLAWVRISMLLIGK